MSIADKPTLIAEEHLVSRLHKGDVIQTSTGLYRVIMVNHCRALAKPLTKLKVVVDGRSFKADGPAISISPNSECDIIIHGHGRG